MENKTKTRNRKDNYTEIRIEKKTGTSIANKMFGRNYTKGVIYRGGRGGTCPGH